MTPTLTKYGVYYTVGYGINTKLTKNNLMTQLNLTNKQQEILTLIPRFRFLDRTHIQTFLKHKDKKRINSWLKNLTEKEYIQRIYDNHIVGKNRRAAIFSLNNNGVRFVKALGIYDRSFIHKLYWDKDRSDAFIERCLFIATICCELEKKESNMLHYEYATESDFCDPTNPFHFLKVSKLPIDLYFKKRKGRLTKHFLLTLFEQTLPRYRLRKRIRDYLEFYYSNDWKNLTNTKFPTLLFVFQTKERMIYAKRYIKTLFDDDSPDDLSINLAVASDVQTEGGVTGEIWEEVE